MYSWDSRCLGTSAPFNTDKNGREGFAVRGRISLGGNSPGKGVIAPQPVDKEPQTQRSLLRASRMCFSPIASLSPSWALSFSQGHDEIMRKWPQGNHAPWPGYKAQLSQLWAAEFSVAGFIS